MARVKARHLAAERCRSNPEVQSEVPAQLAANKELAYTIKELPAVDNEEFE
ncbi:MAG: hypothetical protein ACJ71B_02705 [Nitrososphaera sp.]